MSRPVVKSDKNNNRSLMNNQNQLPALREVNLPQHPANTESHSLVTAYKDLNQPLLDLAAHQRRHLFIAFIVFTILGVGILMGQQYGKSRVIASQEMSKIMPANAEVTSAEHYHYDKSCYKGENGEQVCMTRTSRK